MGLASTSPLETCTDCPVCYSRLYVPGPQYHCDLTSAASHSRFQNIQDLALLYRHRILPFRIYMEYPNHIVHASVMRRAYKFEESNFSPTLFLRERVIHKTTRVTLFQLSFHITLIASHLSILDYQGSEPYHPL